MRRQHLAAAVAALLLVASACEGPRPGDESARGGTVAKDDDTAAGVAEAGETVQVIVRLRFDPPAGAAPGSDAYASALAGVRARFLDGLDFPHRVLRAHDTVPVVVLVVPRAQRAALAGSPLVASVEDDRLNVPLAR